MSVPKQYLRDGPNESNENVDVKFIPHDVIQNCILYEKTLWNV